MLKSHHVHVGKILYFSTGLRANYHNYALKGVLVAVIFKECNQSHFIVVFIRLCMVA